MKPIASIDRNFKWIEIWSQELTKICEALSISVNAFNNFCHFFAWNPVLYYFVKSLTSQIAPIQWWVKKSTFYWIITFDTNIKKFCWVKVFERLSLKIKLMICEIMTKVYRFNQFNSRKRKKKSREFLREILLNLKFSVSHPNSKNNNNNYA